MSWFLLNILLAVLWMLMWPAFDIYNLIVGMVIGYLVLGLVTRTVGSDSGYGTRMWKLLSFFIYFVRILIVANLQVAQEVITPGYGMTPRIVKYDVRDLTPAQITVLANSITLTPGTLSVDVSDDNDWLYIHCMYADRRDQAIAALDELRDRIMQEVFG